MIRDFIASHRKLVIIASGAVVVIVILVVALAVHAHNKKPAVSAAVVTPSYHTLLPSGKTVKSLGGWEKISPPDSTPVYAYADKIGDVSISVSEQTLPDSFQEDTDGSIATLAKSYSATDNLTAGDIKVYIGTNAAGPQSTIFTKDGLLILIKSQKKVADKDWTTYINSLN